MHSITMEEGRCEKVYRELDALYAADSRHYHDRKHIDHCLEKLDEVREFYAGSNIASEADFAIVELSIWFHDAIYTAGDSDNETRSATWFEGWANDHLESVAIERINSLITATKHNHMPVGALEKLMVDIDLSSFALDQQAFMDDGWNIRQEFDGLSDVDFVARQSAFLQRLIDRSSIYSTDYFRAKYEERARTNIINLLEMYKAGFLPELA